MKIWRTSAKKTQEICTLYHQASQMEEEGIHIYCTDEKTGIQAREHKNPSIPMIQGKPQKVDPEYIRHGTTGIIASRQVATGAIVEAMVQATRTEADYMEHIKSVVEVNPTDRHIFIMDNLNTHKSESLVQFVAKVEGIEIGTLGKKNRTGVLKSLSSREDFLSDPSHRVVFVYTPKHCSWLNKIECWFGIITRRLLNRRSSFLSIEDLEHKILSFIAYYNQYLKKPFQ